MHSAGGYLDQKTRSPLSMGAAIAINGAVVGALLLANPEVVERLPKTFIAVPIPAEKPPEPVSEPPKPRVETKQPPRPVVVAMKTPLDPSESDFVTPTTVLPPLGTIGTGSGDSGVVETVTPPHTPVFIGARVHPRYAGALQPPYPPGKQRLGEEGVVVVRVLIGPDGRVKQIERVEAADDAFYKATAEQALKKWRFMPATRDGAPVESWRTMTVRFRLEG